MGSSLELNWPKEKAWPGNPRSSLFPFRGHRVAQLQWTVHCHIPANVA